jgi:hypothetical protein
MRVLALGVALTVVLGGCVRTRPSPSSCTAADPSVLDEIAARLDVDGSLRNGFVHREASSGSTFVTAELHRADAAPDVEGDLLTFAIDTGEPGAFLAVDAYAREQSSWPNAPFDVREPGVIESRGCASHALGDSDD